MIINDEMSFIVFHCTYSSFLIFFNLCAAVTTLSVPPLTSLFLLSGTIAHDPMKSLSWLRTKHVHGNSPGLASPFCFPLISLNLLSPHLFSPCRMFRGSVSRHFWSQNTLGKNCTFRIGAFFYVLFMGKINHVAYKW